jgi:hypothetical protein
MNSDVYLLGGNIKNHIWKLVCCVNNGGDFVDDANFKFIDESNDNYYGLWSAERNEDVPIKNGSNSLNIEKAIRKDKRTMLWDEPDRQHRWDSESGGMAIEKRWRRVLPQKRKFQFKKMKLYGETSGNKKSWRIILKTREDGEKVYSYFEF